MQTSWLSWLPHRAQYELTSLIELSYPIALSLMGKFGLSITELMVAGHLGIAEYTAVAYAQLVLDFTLVVFTQGFDKGLNALAAQAFGAGNFQLVGEYTQLAALCLSLMCVPLGIAWYYCCSLLSLVGISEHSTDLATTYARVSTAWIWPRLMFDVLSSNFQAQQVTLPTAIAALLAMLGNAVFSIVLVFGVPIIGWHGLGFLGCPVALIFTHYLRLGGYVYFMRYIYRTEIPQSIWHCNWHFLSITKLMELLSIGIPLMLGELFKNMQFQIMAVFASVQSEVALDAHNTMMQIVFFLSSPIYGLRDAAVSRLGMYLGAGEYEEAQYASHILLAAMLGISVIIALPWIAAQGILGLFFSQDHNIIQLISSITVLAATGFIILSFFFYAMAILMAQARTLPIMMAFVCGAWFIGVPTAYILSQWDDMGLVGVWSGMAIGYTFTTLIGFYHAQWSNWRETAMRSVERCSIKHAEETTPLVV
ncbi:Multidrug/Oligosaccharidyl-lipid/Polysaccharide (MOP) Flippase Superfamily [Thraustotheca clavata]|uniref:Multidrug/Oligosaccharidyl-lipid/Polysaccharide (MOP) Flippase Superfamily n=1 Tax=Thraustotheca clavata TaxID=74557 RepID=A0A1V9Y8S2_9STRA|nr:Multidrug/Oligosaccharidyl-lipid/Polysaccharide (MOP) Flippase Superfamily [Thraustotheca clavata]